VVSLDQPGQFASFADSDLVSFDLDKDGLILGITVDAPRERWKVEPGLIAPKIGIPATVRFLDAPIQLGQVRLLTEPDYTQLCISISSLKPVHTLELCPGLLLDVGEKGELLAVWILEIQEDYGSRRERAWRTSRSAG